jgi:HCOMODA/2-hydroxy-3-carboxy-muconic semialdehyde decarboxylase
VSDTELVEDLVAANRILVDHGVLDAYGHISARDPGNKERYWLSRSMAPALVTAADVIAFDLHNNPVRPGENRLFFERVIHGEIYKARPDVNVRGPQSLPQPHPLLQQRHPAAPHGRQCRLPRRGRTRVRHPQRRRRR